MPQAFRMKDILNLCLYWFIGSIVFTQVAFSQVNRNYNSAKNEKQKDSSKESIKLNLRLGSPFFNPNMPECVLQIAIQTNPTPENKVNAGINIVFLIDVSATMFRSGNIQFVKTAVDSIKNTLNRTDNLAVVIFSSEASILSNLKILGTGSWLTQLLDTLESGSSTNMQAGLLAAYSVLERGDQPGSVNRIILFTDGVTNARQNIPDEITEKIQMYKNRGIQLSIFGLGQDIDTEQLTTWAKYGNGNFYAVLENQLTEQLSTEISTLLAPVATQVQIALEYPNTMKIRKFLGKGTQIEFSKTIAQLPVIQENKNYTWIATFDPPASKQPVTPKVTVTYFDPNKKRTIQFEQTITLKPTDDSSTDFLTDPEVRYTVVIQEATLFAQQIEKLIHNNSWNQAQETCNQAIGYIQTYYPNPTEPAILALFQQLQKYQELIDGNVADSK